MENSERDGNTRPPELLLENAGQEATVRTGHGTKDWFQIEKRVFSLYNIKYINYLAQYTLEGL